MSIVCLEKYVGRQRSDGDQQSVKVSYLISGTTDEAAAIGALDSTAPSTWNDLNRTGTAVEQIGSNEWTGTATYTSQQTAESEVRFSFSYTGGQQKITSNLQTVSSYGTSPPDCHNLINASKDGVEGVEIFVPQMTFEVNKVWTVGDITNSWWATVSECLCHTNSTTWNGYEAYSLLFASIEGSEGRNGLFPCKYKFLHSPNKTGLTIGPISGIDKRGWDYLEIKSEDVVDGTSITRRPRFVYVHRVYDSADFNDLGLI